MNAEAGFAVAVPFAQRYLALAAASLPRPPQPTFLPSFLRSCVLPTTSSYASSRAITPASTLTAFPIPSRLQYSFSAWSAGGDGVHQKRKHARRRFKSRLEKSAIYYSLKIASLFFGHAVRTGRQPCRKLLAPGRGGHARISGDTDRRTATLITPTAAPCRGAG